MVNRRAGRVFLRASRPAFLDQDRTGDQRHPRHHEASGGATEVIRACLRQHLVRAGATQQEGRILAPHRPAGGRGRGGRELFRDRRSVRSLQEQLAVPNAHGERAAGRAGPAVDLLGNGDALRARPLDRIRSLHADARQRAAVRQGEHRRDRGLGLRIAEVQRAHGALTLVPDRAKALQARVHGAYARAARRRPHERSLTPSGSKNGVAATRAETIAPPSPLTRSLEPTAVADSGT